MWPAATCLRDPRFPRTIKPLNVSGHVRGYAARLSKLSTLSFKHTPFIPGYRTQNFYSSIHHDALPLVSVLVLPL